MRRSHRPVADRVRAIGFCLLQPELRNWTRRMLLATRTLVPIGGDRAPLSVSSLRTLLMERRSKNDRIEHIRVVERAGLIWVGAYVSVAQHDVAQHQLGRLCDRIL